MNLQSNRRWDHKTVWVVVLATCASITAFLIYFRNGEILLFGDAVAHINIARRVFDSRTPGLLQLGTVWLPLPHVLMIPFLLSDRLWVSGAGGSLPSMVAYVLGVVGIFRLVRGTVDSGARGLNANLAGGFAAAIFGLNPNLLYLQSTAMTESLYLACFIWAVVHFCEFIRQRGKGAWILAALRSLWKCGFCLFAACLVRYDGWFLAALIAGVVVVMALRTRDLSSLRAALVFGVIAGAAPVIWFAYNSAVYGNALEFANGPYSARAIEKKTAVPGLPPHPGTGNLAVAGSYFVKAGEFSVAEGNWQRVWLLVAFAGSLLLISRDRRNAALLVLWTPLPFYMLSVAYGGVPIFTPAWWPFSFYNIRYGVQLLPALVVFLVLATCYTLLFVAARSGRAIVGVFAAALVITSYVGVWRAQPGAFREAWVNSRTRLQLERALAEQLQALPARTTLLMYLGEHVGALQDAGIPLKRTINEGNHRVWKQPFDPTGLWEQSLTDPAQHAEFIVAFEGDPVWQAVNDRGLPTVAILGVDGQRTAVIFRTR